MPQRFSSHHAELCNRKSRIAVSQIPIFVSFRECWKNINRKQERITNRNLPVGRAVSSKSILREQVVDHISRIIYFLYIDQFNGLIMIRLIESLVHYY